MTTNNDEDVEIFKNCDNDLNSEVSRKSFILIFPLPRGSCPGSLKLVSIICWPLSKIE